MSASIFRSSFEPASKSQKQYQFAVAKTNYPSNLIRNLKARGNWHQIPEEQGIQQADFFWRSVNLGFMGYEKIDERNETSSKSFLFNHFECNRGICTKTQLIRSLGTYYRQNEEARASNYSCFDSTPTTFVIARNHDDQEINNFIQRHKQIARGGSNKERVPPKHCEENLWLVKPASQNQGKGIKILRSVKEISEFLDQRDEKSNFWVVQKYIEKPLLYKQRKFDLRIWSLVTNNFDIYVYRDGYLRTSSNDYDLTAKDNYVHLTNQCLQNKSEDYGTHEEGNSLSFQDFQIYLDNEFPDHNLKIDEHFMPRIKDIIIDTFLSVRERLNPNNRKDCFELFGFDFLIDEDFRVWLIEVNTNPYMGTPSNFLRILVPQMLDDVLRLAVDPQCPPRVTPDSSRMNNFELIYREGPHKVNMRRTFSLDLCYPIPSLKPLIGKKREPRMNLIRKKAGLTIKKGEVSVSQDQKLMKRNQLNQMQRTSLMMNSTNLKDNNASFNGTLQINSRTPVTPHKSRSKSLVAKNSEERNIERRRGQGRTLSQAKSPRSSGTRGDNKVVLAMLNSTQGQIDEKVAEEDMQSEDEASDEEFKANNKGGNKHKNHLCKSILEQTKELCYQHSPVYKDFDAMLDRVLQRFTNWVLFDDEETMLACQALRVMANSGQMVNLIQQKNMKKLVFLLESDEMVPSVRIAIIDSFIIIAKNIGLRKIFLKGKLNQLLICNSLKVIDMQKNLQRTNEIYIQIVKLLSLVCTMKTNQFYIPGETNIMERLRKVSCDSGTFSALNYLHENLRDDIEPYKGLKTLIKTKILNYAELNDLHYLCKVFHTLDEFQKKQEESKESQMTAESTNAEDNGEESKLQNRQEDSNVQQLQAQTSEDSQQNKSTTIINQQEQQQHLNSSCATPSNNSNNSKLTSPHNTKSSVLNSTSTSHHNSTSTRGDKKFSFQTKNKNNLKQQRQLKQKTSSTNNPLINNAYHTQQNANNKGQGFQELNHNSQSQFIDNQFQQQNSNKSDMLWQPQSGISDKATVKEIWEAPPAIDFPPQLLNLLDLQQLHSDTLTKAEKLKERIVQRKLEERKKVQERQLNAKQKEERIRQEKRQKLGQAALIRAQNKQQNEEEVAKRKAELKSINSAYKKATPGQALNSSTIQQNSSQPSHGQGGSMQSSTQQVIIPGFISQPQYPNTVTNSTSKVTPNSNVNSPNVGQNTQQQTTQVTQFAHQYSDSQNEKDLEAKQQQQPIVETENLETSNQQNYY